MPACFGVRLLVIAFVTYGCNHEVTGENEQETDPGIRVLMDLPTGVNTSEACPAAGCGCPLLRGADGKQVADPTEVEIYEFAVTPNQLRLTDTVDVSWSFSTTTYANGVSIQFYVASTPDRAATAESLALDLVFSDAFRTRPGETQVDTRARHCTTYSQLETSTPGLLCVTTGKYLLNVSFDQPTSAVLQVCSECTTAGFSTCTRRSVPLTFLSAP